ncbi:MAG: hypothetical protein A2X61_14710 [Ignavibacteria bacterium GWB2_35_12]|nr:MAG: hypothetical protein A2X63_06635 [Ignavibacteria bacterium GWA2_35_8]OGU38333.1 MAG: hypothetical protein A2X61_14710 [Ignavibacteria bacterium GWB2_35_12]OGV23432.1 MAG: hypothetical protein A2475_06545 [Ignavibacteria bacterium RIFOXYC2_FULL_35_21]
MLSILNNIARNKERVSIISLFLIIFYLNLSFLSVWHYHSHHFNPANYSNSENPEQIASFNIKHSNITNQSECLICLFLLQFNNAFILTEYSQNLILSIIGIISCLIISLFRIYPTNYNTRAPPFLLFT